jgi:hypothetical protein
LSTSILDTPHPPDTLILIKEDVPMPHEKTRAALSLAIEALYLMTSTNQTTETRDFLFSRTVQQVRALVGPDLRLTTIEVSCCLCGNHLHDKEGNGVTGESSTICRSCAFAQYPDEAARLYASA